MSASELIPAAVVAALVSGVISFLGAVLARNASLIVRDRQTAEVTSGDYE